jgi:hypothetical protein
LAAIVSGFGTLMWAAVPFNDAIATVPFLVLCTCARVHACAHPSCVHLQPWASTNCIY